MPPVTAPTLTDGPVTLRHPQESDVQGSWEQCQDPLSIQWTTVPVPYSHADARDFILGFVPGAWESDKEWGFVVEAEGRYAGHICLRNEGDRRAEIAYGSHPWVRGTGHMEHALRMLLDWGFREKDLATVIWLANVGNWASRRLAWKLGFTFEGTLRQWLPHRGELRDAWTGTLLSGDPREPQRRWLDEVVLDGPGVRLRAFVDTDAERVLEACLDERTRGWLGSLPSPYTVQEALAFIRGGTAARANGDGLSWAVVDPATDLVIGSVGLFDLTDDLAHGEVGYWTHPEARGRGVMTTAVGLVLQHAFDVLGLQRVKAYAAVDNAASRHVLEASGMTEHGLERLGTVLADGRADCVLYDVLRGEWSRSQSSGHSSGQ
ncbi:GNAT family N-acetyltransferase [Nocardioides agariphilus]|uniref:GNAT family N-acetyltransferase n=1 Tax=Nocardioides agariphilus TaxID=433664 RepID=A0A930YGX6_9ACTN|nr:GNAT family N-acetyltransferase [Nocardioides agariphilus]MBF4768026.1 GNAT family N-acetyltransferase [Nocardioides agariphilus]